MNALFKYWNMWCLNPSDDRRRYQRLGLSPARSFCQKYLLADNAKPSDTHPALKQIDNVQHALLLWFRAEEEKTEKLEKEKEKERTIDKRARAGLCLRCYVSEPILRACQKIDSLFSGNKAFSYQDLLPFVLNDDGKTLVVLSEDNKTQLILDKENRLRPTDFRLFTVDVLRTYRLGLPGRMSLDNWAFLQTKQQPELKRFLSESGFQHFSDWALLNRARVNQMERLSHRERCLVEVFHAVYRRDRRKQQKVTRCANPNADQLTEMNVLLQQRGISFDRADQLLRALKQVATQLREFDIWQAREPLEVKDAETGNYRIRTDLPTDSLDEQSIEEQEFIDFLHQQLRVAVPAAVKQSVQTRLAKLKKSKKYSPFAARYFSGLQLYYTEGLSLKEIGSQLGMSSWDQSRRILDPGGLLSQVRALTAQQLLQPVLQKAQAKGLADTPPEPNYLKALIEQIEAFIDAEIFTEAASEIKAGKNRSLESDYAQALKQYIQQHP